MSPSKPSDVSMGMKVIERPRASWLRAASSPSTGPAGRIDSCSTPAAATWPQPWQINLAARTSGNDVVLHALLLRLHTETACRRGGALGLRLADLDTDHGLVRLTEKGATLRWQPITLDLAARLDEHARARGAILPADPVLR